MQRTFRLATFVAGLVVAGSAGAQTSDHLQCFKIRDTAAKATYTADVTPSDPAFANLEPGCTVRLPARLLCVDAVKSGVDPAPPGAAGGIQLQKYLCYKTRCARFEGSGDLTDQFGTHSVTTKSAGLLCAPVEGSLPTTTSTTLPCIDSDSDLHCAGVDDCDDIDPAIHVDATEVCDNADNDCDGFVDGLMRSCYTGASGTAGVGTCHAGAQTCNSGSWGATCPGEVVPVAEICPDGLDNNCDGIADEGCP